MRVRDDRESFFVSNASRTRITSKGYVKKTEVMPAREPDANLRAVVSLDLSGIRICRICSYARNLMPAYGKIRSSVAEWPRNSPRVPSALLISRRALNMPNHVPVYFAN